MQESFFELEEFRCKSGKAYPIHFVKMGRWAELRDTLNTVRIELGHALTVLSGYRDPEYNRKIGGAKASQHMEGRAADVMCAHASPAEVHALVLRLYAEGKLPHLGGLGIYNTFVHIDTRPRNEGQPIAQWHGKQVVGE